AEQRLDQAHGRGPVEVRVLRVESGGAVAEHDQRESLVEPAIAAVAVEQVPACLPRAPGPGLFEAKAEERGLDRVERMCIPRMEVDQRLPALGPRRSGLCRQVPDGSARRRRTRWMCH